LRLSLCKLQPHSLQLGSQLGCIAISCCIPRNFRLLLLLLLLHRLRLLLLLLLLQA
jgi:hypothetical protein